MSEPIMMYSASNVEDLDDIEELQQIQAATMENFWAYWRDQGSPDFIEYPKSWFDYTIDGVYHGMPSQARFVVQAQVSIP